MFNAHQEVLSWTHFFQNIGDYRGVKIIIDLSSRKLQKYCEFSMSLKAVLSNVVASQYCVDFLLKSRGSPIISLPLVLIFAS